MQHEEDNDDNDGNDDEEEEPAFMPSRRGRVDSHHAFMADSEEQEARGGDEWASDDDDEEGMDAFASMERRTEALIQVELDKADESLYVESPLPSEMAAAEPEPKPAPSATTTADDDDAEAQFWATYRAQQEEATRKAKEKEANFVREWASAFVHLRVVGHAIPRPRAKEDKDQHTASGDDNEDSRMVQIPVPRSCEKEGGGWEWYAPCSAASSMSSGASRGYYGGSGLEHMEIKGQASKVWRKEEEEEEAMDKEEVFASHGNGGQIEVLGYDRRPPGVQFTTTSRNHSEAEEEARQAADPAHVQQEEKVTRLVDTIWQDLVELLEAPLTNLLRRREESHTMSGGGQPKPPHKRKLST